MKLLLPDIPPLAPDAPLSDLEARLSGPGADQARQEALQRIGALEQRNVEAIITNEPMPYVLLGNSFLKPYEMTRKGNELLLQKR